MDNIEEAVEDHEASLEQQQVEGFRKKIANRIALESDRLITELFGIVYDETVEAKVKLTAISMLLDRGIPKLGVDHTKAEKAEEGDGHRAIKEEIEALVKGDYS